MRLLTRLRKEEEGQAIILLALAMSFFLILAVGLGIDGSNLYSEHQMAQVAADSAAQAAMMSIFDGTNGTGTAKFSTGSTITCTTTDKETPCVYASYNGFGGTTADTVTVSFPTTAPSGVALSSTDAVNMVQVTVSRQVRTLLLRFLNHGNGPTASTVNATATAGIVLVQSPTPMLITEPTGSGALVAGGSTNLKICGGPTQSIQINSSDPSAFSGGNIDLTQAGPLDPGNCTAGTGASFGVFGGVTSDPLGVAKLGVGKYISPSSPIQDPFANVTPPADPGGSTPLTTSVPMGTDGCVQASTCTLYSPGHYSQLKPGNDTVLFKPGVYYVYGGGVDLKQTTGGGANNNVMCVGCTADTNTGSGMLIYDTGPTDSNGFAATGGFTVDTKVNMAFQGPTLTQTVNSQTVPGPPYYNIVWWEDRNAEAQTHGLGQGNGCFQLTGTLYVTNTKAIMDAAVAAGSTHVQEVDYQGTPCGNTATQGDIIVGRLHLGGNASIEMNLVPYGFLKVRQVALIQ